MSFLFRIGTGSLLCLMPLALYFLFLATLNQRRRPTRMTGRWDFTCLLLGLSGFILLGGPLLISLVDSAWRSMLFSGNFGQFQKAWDTNSTIWSTIAGFYVIALTASIAAFMYLRQHASVIYNIDLATLNELLTVAVKSRGLHFREAIGGLEVGQTNQPVPNNEFTSTRLTGSRGFIVVDSFPALCNATLRWRSYDPELRRTVEEELDKLLQTTESPVNPAAGWMMTASVTTFMVMLFWMAYLVYTLMFRPKGL